ncbi:MAG: TonB-dependent receptor [Rhodospirillales bacterium]|nr:MAG: TonB-dependent receptor [Rhodospirillales bacterium]
MHFRIPIGPGIVNRFVPNPELKPQRTTTWEAGAGIDFQDILGPGDRFQVKGSRYVTRGTDFIDLRVDQPTPFVTCNPFIPGNCDGTTTASNVGRAKLRGTEVEAVYDHPRARLAINYAWIDGKDRDTGERLGVLFPENVNADGAVKLPEIDSIFGWRVTYATRFTKVNDPAQERGSFVVHDTYFAWAPSDGLLQGLRVDLAVDNIFDKAYARAFTGAFETGRNVKGLLTYTMTW